MHRHCALEEQNGEGSTVQRKRKRHGVLTSASPTHPETENGEASGGVFRKGTGTDEKVRLFLLLFDPLPAPCDGNINISKHVI